MSLAYSPPNSDRNPAADYREDGEARATVLMQALTCA